MTNSELFEVIAALIFAKCLESHPVGVDLAFIELAKDATPDNEDGDLMGRAITVAVSTFEWLEREGYLNSQQVEQSMSEGYKAVRGVTLTGNALAILNATPSVLSGQANQVSLKDKIVGAVRDGSKVAMREAIKQLIAVAAMAIRTGQIP